jgi:hypothetical protein
MVGKSANFLRWDGVSVLLYDIRVQHNPWGSPYSRKERCLILASKMSSRKFSVELFARVVHDRARSTSIWSCVIGGGAMNGAVLLYRRVDNLVSRWDGKAADLNICQQKAQT